MDSIDRINNEGKSVEMDIKNHKSFNSDFIEQLDATDEPLDAVTRSIAESDASVAKAKKIRQAFEARTPNTIKLRRQQHVSSCSRKQFMSRSR